MTVSDDQGPCQFAGSGAHERLFSSAFSPLIGPGNFELVTRAIDLSAPSAAKLV